MAAAAAMRAAVLMSVCLALASVVAAYKPAFSYVTNVRKDLRRCAYPYCGGYFVTPANGKSEQYVVYNRYQDGAGDDDKLQDIIDSSAPGQLVLYGYYADLCECGGPLVRCATPVYECNPPYGEQKPILKAFRVEQVYLGLPGVSSAKGNTLYSVEHYTDPSPFLARVLNSLATTKLTGLSFAPLGPANGGPAFLDIPWLRNRVLDHEPRALVAAVVDDANKMAVHQVYIAIPDEVGPCAPPTVIDCIYNSVLVYKRTPSRCLEEVTCLLGPIACPRFLPACDEGYRLAGWPSKQNHGCNEYRCDPEFVPESSIV
eukprot:jgi/Chlat1/4146/Chrsp27S04256